MNLHCRTEESALKNTTLLRAYNLFNAAQISGLPEKFNKPSATVSTDERASKAKEFLDGVSISIGAKDFAAATSGAENSMKVELASRLAADFLCASLGIHSAAPAESAFSPDAWIRLLNDEKKAIFSAASYAQKALDFFKASAPA